MSKIQVNEIVNHFDNGAPDCPRGLTVTGVSTFSGNVSIGGTLSYEDVTNIDSVGVITAQSGIRVPGGRVGIGTDNPVRDLQLGDNTSATEIISLQTTTTGQGSIYFGDSTATSSEYAGLLRYDHADDSMQFRTVSTERLRIDSAGRLLVDTTAAPNLNNASGASARYPAVCFYNTTTDPARRYTAAFIGGSDNANGALIRLGTNRGTSATAANIVNDDDEIGRIDFVGADGTQYVEAAKITCQVDGTPGVNDMPGTILFATTAEGNSSASTRMKVQSDGNVSVTNYLRAGYTHFSSTFLSGNTVWDTGYSINQSNGAGCSLLLASRNTSNGTTTQAAVYRIHWYYDGNNAPGTALLSGSDFITFSTTGANTLGISGNTANWVVSLIHSSNQQF